MTASDKLSITNRQGDVLVGILENKPAFEGDRRVVLFCHGVLGHKDYLFFRQLAADLPLTSFRFDFRGNGESGGEAGYAHMAEDAEDIATVTEYFEAQGYQVYAIIGHSRGSVATLKYASTCHTPIPHIVNCSGRYKMNDNQIYKNRPEIGAALDAQGYFDWNVRQRDRIVQVKVTRADVDRFVSWSNDHVKQMPMSTSVLTVHGINDNIVPVYNAAMFANAIPNHTLILLPDADHNFKGHFDDIVGAIVDYFQKHETDSSVRMETMRLPNAVTLPRWIDVQGVKNFRDLGGWIVADGTGYVRERSVFRCAHLGSITDQGIDTLQKLSVRAVFDFRSDTEIARYGKMPDIAGIAVIPSAMYKEVDFSPQRMADNWKAYLEGPAGIARAYKHTLEVAKEQYRRLFMYMLEDMAQDTRTSMIVHCTAGKDRTGIWCMLLLGVCGVADQVIAQEYALTNTGFWVDEKELEARANNAQCSIEQMRIASSAPYETMMTIIKVIKEDYGSIEGYVQQGCGLTQDQCDQLRKLMVVPISFDQKQLCRAVPAFKQ